MQNNTASDQLTPWSWQPCSTLLLVSYISNCKDEGKTVSLIAMDTFKAFDSVEHGRVLKKLGWYGINRHWLGDWLKDRVQMVRGCLFTCDSRRGSGQNYGHSIFLPLYERPVSLSPHVPCNKLLVMDADNTQLLNSCDRDSLQS